MAENDTRAIALFFFFALLDEKQAREASQKAVQLFDKRLKKTPTLLPSVVLISCTNQIWKKFKTHGRKSSAMISAESGWLVPQTIDLAPWREFQKKVDDEECLMVIWSKILGLKDEDISTALGVTIGTVRYRAGKGLRQLGVFVKPSSKFTPPLMGKS